MTDLRSQVTPPHEIAFVPTFMKEAVLGDLDA